MSLVRWAKARDSYRRVAIWAKNWATFSVHFCASFAVQNEPQIFSQNSSQFITPCLVAEIIAISSPLLGLGGRKIRITGIRWWSYISPQDLCVFLRI